MSTNIGKHEESPARRSAAPEDLAQDVAIRKKVQLGRRQGSEVHDPDGGEPGHILAKASIASKQEKHGETTGQQWMLSMSGNWQGDEQFSEALPDEVRRPSSEASIFAGSSFGELRADLEDTARDHEFHNDSRNSSEHQGRFHGSRESDSDAYSRRRRERPILLRNATGSYRSRDEDGLLRDMHDGGHPNEEPLSDVQKVSRASHAAKLFSSKNPGLRVATRPMLDKRMVASSGAAERDLRPLPHRKSSGDLPSSPIYEHYPRYGRSSAPPLPHWGPSPPPSSSSSGPSPRAAFPPHSPAGAGQYYIWVPFPYDPSQHHRYVSPTVSYPMHSYPPVEYPHSARIHGGGHLQSPPSYHPYAPPPHFHLHSSHTPSVMRHPAAHGKFAIPARLPAPSYAKITPGQGKEDHRSKNPVPTEGSFSPVPHARAR